jgi:hypothetical protein
VSELVLLVRQRGVDLVVMSAAAALRGPCGLGERLLRLLRDDGYLVEVPGVPDGPAWERACTARADWFNPNKHRYALYAAAPGGIAAVREADRWPWPWLLRRLGTDRPDLAGMGGCDELDAWLALAGDRQAYAVSLAAWQRDPPVEALPRGHWPAAAQGLVRLQLWTLVLRSQSADEAEQLAMNAAITRTQTQGLLIHPHMQGWARLGPPRRLPQEAAR